ncbi:MAG: hypothetical protein FIO03_06635 [Nitrosopumilales archaeon]|nr:hypothetical protein [Nitrosopumilales archaeon]
MKFEKVDISDTDSPKCIFSKDTHNGMFCPWCGMALRVSPTDKRDEEKLRQEEQYRIIRVIQRIKK